VIVTTPYYMHAKMAAYAMEYKHAAWVPAAATLDECWMLWKPPSGPANIA
jgi:hypothetical protein